MLQSISVNEMDFDIGINYTLPNADELLKNTLSIYPKYGELIKIDFSNFMYDIITIEFTLEYFFIYPKKAQDFNFYVDKINNDYGIVMKKNHILHQVQKYFMLISILI